MIDLSLIKYFIGIEVEKFVQGICISQHKYAIDILKRFRMVKWKLEESPIATCMNLSKQDEEQTINSTLYKKLVGSIKYLTKTRPTLMYGVGFICIFMESPKYSN